MAELDTTPAIVELMALLDHQRTLYRRLRMLAERQKALVMLDDAQPLLDLLNERQRLVDGLVALGGKIAPYRERWPALYAEMDEPTRRAAAALLEEVNASLSMILQRDRQDTAMLDVRRQDAAWRMASMNNHSRASSAYAAAGAAAAMVATDARG